MRSGLLGTFLLMALLSWANPGKSAMLDIQADACENLLEGESRAGARIRAADKAVYNGIKKQQALSGMLQKLNDHDANVLIYRLGDEYIEDLSVQIKSASAQEVCVEISGQLDENTAKEAYAEFLKERSSFKEAKSEVMEQIVREVGEEIALTPDNPNELALLYIADLSFFNGTSSAKSVEVLKQMYADNPYFYLTEDSEIADYVIKPKVLTAKIDKADETHNRLHMVVVLEIEGLTPETSGEFQNRFAVFEADENKQEVASQMLNKLLELAGQKLLERIETNEQRKLERRTLGRRLDS